MAKVTRKQVEQAAAEYGRQRALYGEQNLSTSRALGRWQDLQRQYESQTGKPMYRANTPTHAGPVSERKAWARIAAVGRSLGNERSSAVASMGREIEALAKAMLAQVAAGVHRNPPETWDEVRQMSGRVYEIRYKHVEDAEPYRHPFGAGVQMWAVRQGNDKAILIVHKDHKPLWKEF